MCSKQALCVSFVLWTYCKINLLCGLQVPVIQVMLGQLGLVTSQQMLAQWRYVVVGATVAAAVLTPSTDPFTQVGRADFCIKVPSLSWGTRKADAAKCHQLPNYICPCPSLACPQCQQQHEHGSQEQQACQAAPKAALHLRHRLSETDHPSSQQGRQPQQGYHT